MLVTVLLAPGCGSDADLPVTTTEQVDLPVLDIDQPERAAFMGQQTVRIQGQAIEGSAALDSLTVNDQESAFDSQGNIDLEWTPETGLNILGFRLEDVDDERAVDGRAFIWGPTWDSGQTIPGSLRLLLGPDLSDISSLLELVLEDPSTAQAMVGMTMEYEYADITVTSADIGGASVNLNPVSGALEGDFIFTDIWITYDVLGVDWYDWVSVSGSAWMDSLDIFVTLDVYAQGGKVWASTTAVDATINGFGFQVDWVPSFLEDLLVDWVSDMISSSLEEDVGDIMEELVEQYLAGLAMDTVLGEENPIHLSLALDSIEITSSGIRLELDASAWAKTSMDLPENAGSPHTEESQPDWDIAQGGSFAVLADDDLVNQFLFAYWATGALSHLTLDADEMTTLAGESLEPPLGPVDKVRIDFDLPPLMDEPTQDDQQMDLDIGELRLAFDRSDGVTLDFSINVSTGAVATFDENDSLLFTLDSRPAYVGVDVGVLEYDHALDPGDLAALIRLMVPPLLGSMGEVMPSFQVPPLDLGEITGFSSLAGVSMSFKDPEISVTQEGWLLLKGSFGSD